MQYPFRSLPELKSCVSHSSPHVPSAFIVKPGEHTQFPLISNFLGGRQGIHVPVGLDLLVHLQPEPSFLYG